MSPLLTVMTTHLAAGTRPRSFGPDTVMSLDMTDSKMAAMHDRTPGFNGRGGWMGSLDKVCEIPVVPSLQASLEF